MRIRCYFLSSFWHRLLSHLPMIRSLEFTMHKEHGVKWLNIKLKKKKKQIWSIDKNIEETETNSETVTIYLSFNILYLFRQIKKRNRISESYVIFQNSFALFGLQLFLKIKKLYKILYIVLSDQFIDKILFKNNFSRKKRT